MMLKHISILLIILWMPSAMGLELRDPTTPPGMTGDTDFISSSQLNAAVTIPTGTGDTEFVPAWQLDAVIISQNHSVAIINGKPIQMGEQIKGHKLVNISPYSVQLEGVDGKITLFLLDNSLKIE